MICRIVLSDVALQIEVESVWPPSPQIFRPLIAMPQESTKSYSKSYSWFSRAIEFWPYVCIVISVTGLAYIALNAVR